MLKEGEHEVKFVLKNGEREGEATCAALRSLLEFGDKSKSVPSYASI